MRKALMLSTCTAALLLTGPLAAQEQRETQTQQSQTRQEDRRQTQQRSGKDWSQRDRIRVVSADRLMGQAIKDDRDETIADIDSVLIDQTQNSIRFLVVDVDEADLEQDRQQAQGRQRGLDRDGSQARQGDQRLAQEQREQRGTLVPLPWEAVTFQRDGRDMTVRVDRQRLASAQRFTEDQLDQAVDQQMITAIYNHWVPMDALQDGAQAQRQNRGQNRNQDRAQDRGQDRSGGQGQSDNREQRTNRADQQGSADRMRQREGQAQSEPQEGRQALTRSDGDTTYLWMGHSFVSVLLPGLKSFAELDGTDVYGSDGKDLGEIEDVIIDRETGRIAFATISHGGFLGVGQAVSPVPLAALQYQQEENHYRLAVSADTLEGMDHFQRGDTPRSIRTADLRKLYREFGAAMDTRGQGG